MPSRKKKANHYLAMWDMLGLECIFDITKLKADYDIWEKAKIWRLLKDEKADALPPTIPIRELILRAKFNSQRSYEIYEFNSTMSENELRIEFARNPQPIVNWIRDNGYKVYSDYVKQDRKMIV